MTSTVRFGTQTACGTAGQHLGERCDSEAARKIKM